MSDLQYRGVTGGATGGAPARAEPIVQPAHRPLGPATATALLEADPRSVGAARQLVREALRAWGRPEAEDAVALLLSELVANAVRHAESDVEVVIRPLPGIVRGEVRDRSSNHPQPRYAGPEDESGRGLFLVDALAHAWGVDAHADGKSVWFEVLLD